MKHVTIELMFGWKCMFIDIKKCIANADLAQHIFIAQQKSLTEEGLENLGFKLETVLYGLILLKRKWHKHQGTYLVAFDWMRDIDYEIHINQRHTPSDYLVMYMGNVLEILTKSLLLNG